MALYGTPQFNKRDTIALGSSLNPPAASFTLASGNFGSPSGSQILIIDWNDNTKATVISCLIAGTSVSSVVYLDGATSANHAGGAPVTMGFTPTQYNSLIDGTGLQFPAWTAWTPTYTGLSANPTTLAFYQQLGKLVIVSYYDSTPGTSNATTHTLTLPVAAKRSGVFLTSQFQDNGVQPSNPGSITTTAGSNIATVYRDSAGTGWTASGNCFVRFNITYEAN